MSSECRKVAKYILQDGQLVNANFELSSSDFESAMRGQIALYVQVHCIVSRPTPSYSLDFPAVEDFLPKGYSWK